MRKNERAKLAIATCVFILILCPAGIARIIYVDNDGPADFSTIQAAIDDANNGDMVVIQPGIYTGPGNRDIDFRAKAITVCSEQGPGTCVINCEGSESDPHRGFIFQNGEGNGSVLSGLTIIDGYADSGGAIYCMQAEPIIRNCILTGNMAVSGGAITIHDSNARIEKCLIWGNQTVAKSAGEAGGGIHLRGFGGGRSVSLIGRIKHPRIVGCTITRNASKTGGGVFATLGCDVTVANCIIWDNVADRQAELELGKVWDAPNATVVVSHSDIKDGLKGIIDPERVTWGNGNLDVAPGFVDPQAGDFHLRADSSCIDAGDPNYVPVPGERDIDGEPRMMNGRVDIGADEHPAALLPTLAVSKSQLRFDANEGEANPVPQSLLVYNAVAGAQLTWGILHDSSWLEIDPTQGQSSGETTEVTLAPDISDLARGLYVCEAKVDSKGSLRSPQTVRIELAVHGPVLELSTTRLSFQGIAGQADLPSQIVRLTNRGSHAVVWQCQSACNWLSVHPMSGTTAESDEITITLDLMRLVAGTYKCDLVFSDSNAEKSPQTVAVTATLTDNDRRLMVPAEYPNIQAAINVARNGEYVVIMRGTYRGAGNRDLDPLGKAITIGGTDPNDWGVVAATVIDCQSLGRGFVISRSEKRTTVIEGLTITGGYAGTSGNGGGINVWANSSPTIRSCLIRGNRAGGGGAGIACVDSGATVINCHVYSNTANQGGGGIGCTGPNALIKGCSISGNFAGAGGGACLDARNGSVTMSNCLLENNFARAGGGVCIAGDQGAVGIDSCTIAVNVALEGGGICYEPASETNAQIANCILWANAATNGPELALIGPTDIPGPVLSCAVRYSDVQGGAAGAYIVYTTTRTRLDWGAGNIDSDPLFADSDREDFHLKSRVGRWSPKARAWVQDAVNSPCIDAGDTSSPVDGEPEPNGGRVNMGAYGGTAEASKSYPGK